MIVIMSMLNKTKYNNHSNNTSNCLPTTMGQIFQLQVLILAMT